MRRHDVVIVGAGPAGLSAARRLREAGIDDVVIVEREAETGGVPRHCRHPGFGLSQLYWPYSGPAYARRLAAYVDGMDVRRHASVVKLDAGGELVVATADGLERLAGRCVLLATGIRESPRPARLVSGERPRGLMTTGALQQFLHLAGIRPFSRPVVVGSELVAFSALLTLAKAGIRAVAMIEENARITAPRPSDMIVRAVFGVPVLTACRLVRILGGSTVCGVEVERRGARAVLDCDGVVFTGRFVPEASLIRDSHLAYDPATGGPVIDQHWRCSDPAYFVAGNRIRPVESAGVAGREGEAAARAIVRALRGRLEPPQTRIAVCATGPLRYVYPQVIALPGDRPDGLLMKARVARPARGRLALVANGREIWARRIDALPERRIRLPGRRVRLEALETLEVRLDERAAPR